MRAHPNEWGSGSDTPAAYVDTTFCPDARIGWRHSVKSAPQAANFTECGA